MATAKGHMVHNKEIEKEDFGPQQQHIQTSMVYLIPKLAEEFNHTIKTYLTGNFSVTFQAGNKYVKVEYDYDSNSIIQVPAPNHSDSDLTKAINYIYTY
eukprot:14934344-Ditylum_brightwellii.AAC.1